MRIKWRLQIDDEPEWGDSLVLVPFFPSEVKDVAELIGNTVNATLVRMLERRFGLPDSEDARLAEARSDAQLCREYLDGGGGPEKALRAAQHIIKGAGYG